MAQMNLFEALAGPLSAEMKLTEEVEKKKEKKTKSKGATNGKYSVGSDGLTIITGYYPETCLKISDFSNEEKDEISVSESDIVKAVIKKGLKFIEGCTNLKKLKSEKFLITSNYSSSQKKVEVSGEWTIALGGFEVPVNGDKVSNQELIENWVNAYPEHEKLVTAFLHDEEHHVLIPKFTKGKIRDSKKGVISIFGQQPKEFENKKPEEAAKELFPELEGNFFIVSNEESFFVIPEIKNAAPVKEVETYPTSGVKLVAGFQRFDLTPDMFGGKTEITAKELIKFVSEDFPEYGGGRGEVSYMKKEKILYCQVKASRKGAGLGVRKKAKKEQDIVKIIQAIIDSNEKKTHSLFYVVKPSGDEVRIEKNEVGTFIADKEKEYQQFYFSLPRIPKSIMEEIYTFFYNVKTYKLFSNEAAAQIFWNKKLKKYFVYYPKQAVSAAAVRFERDFVLEQNNVLVMDVHSHGDMSPFFSSIDDADEKGTRLFCVFGNLNDTCLCHYQLRAGTAGRFIKVNSQDIFENDSFINMRVSESRKKEILNIISEKVNFE